MQQDNFTVDAMHVAVPRAAGIDVHKMELTATVRLCSPGCPDASMATRSFGTHPAQLAALAAWLHSHRVEAATWQRQLDLLETIPGIARTSAHAILAEVGPEPTQVFADAASLAAWAGVCPGNNESAGKRRSGRLRPGNPTLRATLAECAHGAARTKDSQFYGYHDAMRARIGYKRSILATAHKLLRTIYAILRDGHPYKDPQVNYEQLLAQRNEPRWIRMLEKHGLPQE